MSQQVTDPFMWKGRRWVFLGADDVHSLFDPKTYGLNPSPPTTDCWKGFVVHFCVKHNELFLEKLDVYCHDGVYPKIAGISPSERIGTDFRRYKNIHQKLVYSGIITIGRGYLKDYLDRSFTGPHMYKKVYELHFKNGGLQNCLNTSDTYSGF